MPPADAPWLALIVTVTSALAPAASVTDDWSRLKATLFAAATVAQLGLVHSRILAERLRPSS